MRRWALAGAVVAVALLGLVLGVVALFSNASCAHLTVERVDASPRPTPEGEPVALDEARVRSEAPQLAALLDRAVEDGRATTDHERTARAMSDYLDRATDGHGRLVAWRGVALRTLLAVC